MEKIILGRTSFIWLVLMVATVLSYGMGHSLGDERMAGIAVMVIAFVKVRLVVFEFMEIRDAPRMARVVAEASNVVAFGVMIYLLNGLC